MKTMLDYVDELWFEYLVQEMFLDYIRKEPTVA